MIRVFSLLIVFGWGAQALGGGAFGVLVSGGIALALNQAWKKHDRQQYLEARREAILTDEAAYLEIHRRAQTTEEGRP